MNTKTDKGKLKIGLPSPHSRLHPKVMKILGLPRYSNSHRLVFYSDPATVFFLRPWDLPKMIELGYIDVALCGLDTVKELGVCVVIHQQFKNWESPIAFCKRVDTELATEKHLLVATEYPKITKEYLSGRYDSFEIVYVRGATEAYPHLGNISAIVDIVETGDTLKGNYLHWVDQITYTCPCLIYRVNSTIAKEDLDIKRLAGLIQMALELDLSCDDE